MCAWHACAQVLTLHKGHAEWSLYATAPDKIGPLRDLLLHPVARMVIRPPAPGAGAGGALAAASHALLAGSWELCLPTLRTVPLVLGALGEPVDSWQVSIGLTGPWDGHTRYRRWSVALGEGARAALDADVSGERTSERLDHAHPPCMVHVHGSASGSRGGTPCAHVHAHVVGHPLTRVWRVHCALQASTSCSRGAAGRWARCTSASAAATAPRSTSSSTPRARTSR